MEKSVIVKLPSGAELEIRVAEFAVGWDLYQTVVREQGNDRAYAVQMVANKPIEKCILACLKTCTYAANGKDKARIDADTFEPIEARQDYILVLFNVAKENLDPFAKALT